MAHMPLTPKVVLPLSLVLRQLHLSVLMELVVSLSQIVLFQLHVLAMLQVTLNTDVVTVLAQLYLGTLSALPQPLLVLLLLPFNVNLEIALLTLPSATLIQILFSTAHQIAKSALILPGRIVNLVFACRTLPIVHRQALDVQQVSQLCARMACALKVTHLVMQRMAALPPNH
jgi:hypothetical protein